MTRMPAEVIRHCPPDGRQRTPCCGVIAIGDKVLAVEPEDKICTDAEVVDIDQERQLVYLAVDWAGWRDDLEAEDDEETLEPVRMVPVNEDEDIW